VIANDLMRVIFNRVILFFLILFFLSCQTTDKPIQKLENVFNGEFYSISYPDGFKVTKGKTGLKIEKDWVVIIETKTIPGLEKGDIDLAAKVADKINKTLTDNKTIEQVHLGNQEAILLVGSKEKKFFIGCFIPIEDHLINVYTKNFIEEKDLSTARSMILSFIITNEHYFVKNALDIEISSDLVDSKFFSIKIPKGWLSKTLDDSVFLTPERFSDIDLIQITPFQNPSGVSSKVIAGEVVEELEGESLISEAFFGNTFFTILASKTLTFQGYYIISTKGEKGVLITSSTTEDKLPIELKNILQSLTFK